MFDSPSGQDVCKPADVHGHLLILRPTDCRTVTTSFGDSDGVELDLVDLDDTDDTGQPGKVYRGAMWFPKALVNGLRPKIGGQPVLATVVQGTAKPGQSAPWLLQSATDDPAQVQRASSWIGGHPEFLGAGFAQPAAAPKPAPAPAAATPTPAAAPAAPDLSALSPEARAVVEQMLAKQG